MSNFYNRACRECRPTWSAAAGIYSPKGTSITHTVNRSFFFRILPHTWHVSRRPLHAHRAWRVHRVNFIWRGGIRLATTGSRVRTAIALSIDDSGKAVHGSSIIRYTGRSGSDARRLVSKFRNGSFDTGYA